jgi:hypothetical protein
MPDSSLSHRKSWWNTNIRTDRHVAGITLAVITALLLVSGCLTPPEKALDRRPISLARPPGSPRAIANQLTTVLLTTSPLRRDGTHHVRISTDQDTDISILRTIDARLEQRLSEVKTIQVSRQHHPGGYILYIELTDKEERSFLNTTLTPPDAKLPVWQHQLEIASKLTDLK